MITITGASGRLARRSDVRVTPQHAQVAAAAQLNDRCRHPDRNPRPRSLPYRVGQRLKVVARGPQRIGIGLQSHDFPASRGGHALVVGRAQVVAVRFRVRGKWPENCGLVGIDIGQRRHGCTGAGGLGTSTHGAHVADTKAADRRRT